jgi:pyridoxamine 5'-phosphate oxidase
MFMGALANIRNEYRLNVLSENNILKNPILQASAWLEEALKLSIPEPTAMNLATVSLNNRPSSRIVLLKGITENGFIFYSNYQSKKGIELENNPFASLTIFWKELERQIRIEGKVEKTSSKESDLYFNSRPIGSKIGAIVSPQSKKITSREELEDKQKILENAPESQISRPENWGGYILIPDYIEFWQGRTNRLHDRLAFQLEGTKWEISRLAP